MSEAEIKHHAKAEKVDYELSDVVPIDAIKAQTRELDEYDRLTFVLRMHHQNCCDPPMSLQVGFAHLTKQREQPFQRRRKLKAGSRTKLDLGWLLDGDIIPGYLVVQNRAQIGQKTNPTEEDIELLSKSVIQIGNFVVRPDRVFLAEIGDGQENHIILEAAGDGLPEIDVTITIYPR
jgi:hypothetical protein